LLILKFLCFFFFLTFSIFFFKIFCSFFNFIFVKFCYIIFSNLVPVDDALVGGEQAQLGVVLAHQLAHAGAKVGEEGGHRAARLGQRGEALQKIGVFGLFFIFIL
jgi:hypothetical protein